MTVLQLGIHAPYTWDTSTNMACVLGDLATSLGLPVSYLSYQAHNQNVHEVWDARVKSSKRNSFDAWVTTCSHIVWFAVHKNKLEIARKKGCHNTLVLLWNRLTREDLDMLPYFDTVVCPTAAAYTVAYGLRLHRHLYEIPWDSGLPIENQLKPVEDGRQKVLTIVEGPAARKNGAALLSTIEMLLDSQPTVDLTICHNRSWSRPTQQQLTSLADRHFGRIVVKQKPHRTWRHLAYGHHHWTWLPNLQTNTGFHALESLASNCPVLTFDISPMNEIVRQGYNGHLVYCETDYNWLGVPCGHLNSRAMLAGVEEALEDRKYQEALRQMSWPERADRRDYFKRTWKKLWQIET